MSYTVEDSKAFNGTFNDTFEAARSSIKTLKGKVLVDKPDKKRLEARMDKKLYGKVLGDYSKLEIDFSNESDDTTTLSVTAYPINPVGQKLMFGAREGVVPKVVEAFYDEVEKALSSG